MIGIGMSLCRDDFTPLCCQFCIDWVFVISDKVRYRLTGYVVEMRDDEIGICSFVAVATGFV